MNEDTTQLVTENIQLKEHVSYLTTQTAGIQSELSQARDQLRHMEELASQMENPHSGYRLSSIVSSSTITQDTTELVNTIQQLKNDINKKEIQVTSFLIDFSIIITIIITIIFS